VRRPDPGGGDDSARIDATQRRLRPGNPAAGLDEALWDGHDIRRTDTDTLEVDHPRARLVLTLVNLQGVATPGMRFNAYLPADEATAEILAPLRATPSAE
jgi:hypothetical protein